MRSICLLAASLYYCVPAISQGIQFQKNISWKDALSMAEDSNKMVFVDVYTDWCGPCQEMNKEVFTLREIGDKFNNSFINYQLNAEKGEGPALKSRYHIVSYPTYLFVRSDGTLIYKARSAMSPRQLLQEAGNALQEANKPITIVQMDNMYPLHKYDKSFMYNYVQRRTHLALENAALLDEYFGLLNASEQGELKNLQLVVDNGSFLNKSLDVGPAFYALLKNKDMFHLLKTNVYNNDLQTIIAVAKEKTLSEAIKKKSEKLLKEALKFNNHTDLFEGDDVVRMRYYKETGQNRLYFTAAKQYISGRLMTLADTALDRMDQEEYDRIIPQVDSSLAEKADRTAQEKEEIRHSYKRTQTIQVTNMLYDICRNVLHITNNRDTLRLCLPWIRRCIYLAQRDTGYFRNVYPLYLDNYASYLYELNEKSEAIKNEQRAIDLMKNMTKNNVPEKYTTRLLQMKNNEPLNLHD
jgi:thiol-disulfide isomerase/thioredoxin